MFPAVKKKKKETVLSTEDNAACLERLYDRAKEDARRKAEKRRAAFVNPPGRLPAKHLSKEQVVTLTTRMYDRQLEHQKLKQSQAEKKKADHQATMKALSEEETNEMVQRMYHQQRDIAAKNLEKLRRKYQPEPEKKALTKDQVAAMGDRLSKGWREKRDEIRKQIFDKYIAPMEPKRHTVTEEEVKAMADRLCTVRTKAG